MTDYELDPIAGVYRLRRWHVTRPPGSPWRVVSVILALVWLFGRYQGAN